MWPLIEKKFVDLLCRHLLESTLHINYAEIFMYILMLLLKVRCLFQVKTDTDFPKSKSDSSSSKAFAAVVGEEEPPPQPCLVSPLPVLLPRRVARGNRGHPVTFEFHINNDLKKKRKKKKKERHLSGSASQASAFS